MYDGRYNIKSYLSLKCKYKILSNREMIMLTSFPNKLILILCISSSIDDDALHKKAFQQSEADKRNAFFIP